MGPRRILSRRPPARRGRSPGARHASRFLAAVSLLLLAVFVSPGAHASDETSPVRAVVGAGVSRGCGRW
jgi:hypothetical protein